MADAGSAKDFFPGYNKAPTEIGIKTAPQGTAEKHQAFAEYKEPVGEQLFKDGSLEVLAPLSTNFPVDSGLQIQVVDRSIKTSHERQTPLLSDVDPKKILGAAALGIRAEEVLVAETDTPWANLNLHSRPPITPATPNEAQYDSVTVDIHGRDIGNPMNWTRPPATHGVWGSLTERDYALRTESFDEQGNTALATSDEIEKYRADPMSRVYDSPSSADSKAFEDWREHPTGMYEWITGRRNYTIQEITELKKLYTSDEFARKVADLKQLELFTGEDPEPEYFESNDTDTPLWEFGGYQLVTQKVPLVDEKEGIHMVLKLRPEPHTPWDNTKQALEAMAIGIGVARLLQDTTSLGEIGDVYLDFNANWSMTTKSQGEAETPEEFKRRIQKDTRAHLHIQLEKMAAQWELPPAPGTFADNQPQKESAVSEIRQILGKKNGGLHQWLMQNCKGKLFPES